MDTPNTSEQENKGNPTNVLRQMCRINVTFPVSTDAEALAVKGQLQEAVKDIPEAQIMFTIVSAPMLPTVR